MALSISNYKKGTPGGTASKRRTTFGGGSARQMLSSNKNAPSSLSSTSANDDKVIEPTTTQQVPPTPTPAVAPAVPVPPGATAGQPIDLSGLMPGSASYNEAVLYNQSLTAPPVTPGSPDGAPVPIGGTPPDTKPGALIIGSVSREGGRGRGSQWAGQEMPAELVNQVPADNMAEFSAAVTKGPMALMSYLTNNIAQPWAKSILMGLRSNRTRGTANVTRTFDGGSMWDRSPAWMKQRYMQNTAPEPVPAIQPAYQPDQIAQLPQQTEWTPGNFFTETSPDGKMLRTRQPDGSYTAWMPNDRVYAQDGTGIQGLKGPFLQDTEPQDFSNWGQSGGMYGTQPDPNYGIPPGSQWDTPEWKQFMETKRQQEAGGMTTGWYPPWLVNQNQGGQSGGIVDPRQLQYQQLMQQLPYFAALLQGSVPQQGGY